MIVERPKCEFKRSGRTSGHGNKVKIYRALRLEIIIQSEYKMSLN